MGFIDISDPFFMYLTDCEESDALKNAAREIAAYPGFRESHTLPAGVLHGILRRCGFRGPLTSPQCDKLKQFIREAL